MGRSKFLKMKNCIKVMKYQQMTCSLWPLKYLRNKYWLALLNDLVKAKYTKDRQKYTTHPKVLKAAWSRWTGLRSRLKPSWGFHWRPLLDFSQSLGFSTAAGFLAIWKFSILGYYSVEHSSYKSQPRSLLLLPCSGKQYSFKNIIFSKLWVFKINTERE